ncbi:MAG: hypothetical protein AB9834_16410 [Lentimicrobium sp.]
MNSKYYSVLFIITIASTLLYVVSNNLPAGLGSFRFLWGPLSMVAIVVLAPTIILKTPIKQLLIFGLFVVGILQYSLWSFMDDWNRMNILDDFYAIISFSMIYFFLIQKQDSYTLAKLSKWSLLFLVVTLITTNIALTINPMIVRYSAGFDPTGESKTYFVKLGSGDYPFMNLLVCIIPALVYFVKLEITPFINKKILIIILVVIILTQIRGQIFANIIVSFVVLILSFVNPQKRKRLLFISALFLLISIFLPLTELLGELLKQSSKLFEYESDINYKINDFANFLTTPELTERSGTGSRAERYPLLWDAFIKAPFLGNSSYTSSENILPGGHLYWMNRLTLWGIFGFFAFIYSLYLIFKNIYQSFDREFRFFYALSLLSFVILGLMKQITGREPWLVMIIIIPGLYHLQKRYNIRKGIKAKSAKFYKM